jgi:MFS transporter, ENTS family, enterobactin (siderophore) exporter
METLSIPHSRRAQQAWSILIPALLVVAIVLLALPSVWPAKEAAYALWNGNLGDGRALARWLLSAWTEAEFYTSDVGGAGLLAGALLASWAEGTRKSWRGLGLACESGLWRWTAASSTLGLLLSNLVWGWTLHDTGLWQPTFVPVVSVAPTVVLIYGPGWRTLLTGAVLSAVVVTPLSLAATDFVCRPLGLPLVVGVTGGMALGGISTFALCRLLPELSKHAPLAPARKPRPEDHGFFWAARRMLADFSEAQFFGNEWASGGLILGALLAFHLAPEMTVYDSRLLPQVLAAQALTALLGMAIWWHRWLKRGFFPTFVPIVSVAPTAVMAFGGTIYSILGGAALGALTGPPFAAFISDQLPPDFHPFIGNVAAMAICTAVTIPKLSLLHAAP